MHSLTRGTVLSSKRLAKVLAFGLLFWAQVAFGQGVVIAPQTALKTVNGVTSVIPAATITVCAANIGGLPCSPALVGATFKDPQLTQPLANPSTADANGNYNFAIATGTYTVTVTASGFTGYSYQLSAPCLPASCAGIGKQMLSQNFTSSGTFTIPVGVTSAKVTVIAGGGAGGGASAAAGQAAGGGSGGIGIKWLAGLTPGNTLTVAVGTGGVGAANAIGGNGVASSVSSGTQTITTITANPGQGGAGVGGNFGGPGGTQGTGGDTNWGGTQATHAPSIANVGSPGAPGPFGGGGAAGFQAAGTLALAPGGGGGAAGGNAGGNVAGGAGAAGIVIFEWVN